MDKIAQKWDKKFALTSCASASASEVLTQNVHLLPTEGRALDYACGLGGNALLLARNNFDIRAWDISQIAIDKLQHFANGQGLKITASVRDVETYPPEYHSFDVVVVSNFLHRPSFNALLDSIRPGGLLFYQTFIVNRVDEIGPSNPNYLLTPNELIRLCAGLEILVYREEGLQGNTELGWRNQAMIVAQKPVTNSS